MLTRVVVLFGLSCVSCAAKATPTGADAGTAQPCSTGTPYTNDQTQFPFGSPSGLESYPECTPHCGATKTIRNHYPLSALPSGSCSGEQACKIDGEVICDCPLEQGAVSEYLCRCTMGQWQCSNVVQGGAVCINECKSSDAGGDAGHR